MGEKSSEGKTNGGHEGVNSDWIDTIKVFHLTSAFDSGVIV